MSIYCVYRITNIVEHKHYYGYKKCVQPPTEVIGVSYFSSSTDKSFIIDQRKNRKNYKYKIVAKFDSKEKALEREVLLHKKFDVKNNSNFYNKVNQSSMGFDVTGTTAVIDSSGNVYMMNCEDFKNSTEVTAYNNSKQTTKTKLEKYNDPTYCNSKQIKETMLERYGVENMMQLDHIKEIANEKAKATRLKNLGYEYALQSPVIREKIKETWKKTGRHKKEKHPLAKRIRISAPDGMRWDTHGNFKSTIQEIAKTYKISYKILNIILKGLKFSSDRIKAKYSNWKCEYI